MRTSALLIGGICVALITSQLSAAVAPAQESTGEASSASPVIIFDNLTTTGGLDPAGASPASQVDTVFPFDAGAADDFVLPASPLCRWKVAGVRWTGKYWGDAVPGTVTGFRIVFWADEEGVPAGGGLTRPDLSRALAVHSVTGTAGETANPSGNPGAFDYEVLLPSSLELLPGIRYWIQIQTVAGFPPQWGVHITHGRQGSSPVQYFDLLGLLAWTPVPDDGDLAFQLLGEPSTVVCDDGNACTEDACASGVCASTPITCDDGDACTSDSCDPAQGCVFSAVDCGDENSCTTDVCLAGVCEHYGPPDFDGDGDVDALDLPVLESCLLPADGTALDGCGCADLNNDGRVDLIDAAMFQRLFTGSK